MCACECVRVCITVYIGIDACTSRSVSICISMRVVVLMTSETLLLTDGFGVCKVN